MSQMPPIIDEAEIVIVGAGPAGSTAAATLAELGHDIILIDKDRFPRDKPCGDGITPSAVSFLKKLDMHDLLDRSQSVEGLQIFYDHSCIESNPYRKLSDEPWQAKCIPRRSLDNAMLDAAIAKGARFLNGLVSRPILKDGRAVGVELKQNGMSAQISARYFIAADGATSRMRRESGTGQHVYDLEAYAVRQYCETEKSLDPVFNFFIPLELNGDSFVGYGWVFPVEERLANIGVGYYSGPGLASPPPITRLLDSFIWELQGPVAGRFGEIERTGKPFGSPVSVNFSSDLCQFENIVFVGDAARTTDPLNGGGIVYALHGGEIAALSLHDSIKKGVNTSVGLRLARHFPRLGQDVSVIARTVQRGLNRSVDKRANLDLFTQGKNPFINSMIRLISCPENGPDTNATPVRLLVEDYDRDQGKMLDHVNERALTELRTEFPLAFEILYREMQSNAGPTYATTLLLSANAVGTASSDELISAAVSVELLALFTVFTSRVVDREKSNGTNFNNAMAVLLADFAVSRAFASVVKLGASSSGAFGRTARAMCEGQMLEIEDVFKMERTVERYFRAIKIKTAGLFGFSARLGADAAGAEDGVTEQLEHYGHDLGLAFQISNDVIDLLVEDGVTGKPRGTDLRSGIYTLPVLYALGASSELQELLKGDLTDERLEKAVKMVGSTDGVDRSLEVCQRHVDAAKEAIETLKPERSRPLVALADLAISRVVELLDQTRKDAFDEAA